MILQLDPSIRVQVTGIPFYPLIKTMSMVVYGCLSLIRLKNYSKSLMENYSSVDKINLKWLRNLIRGYIFFLSVIVLMMFIPWKADKSTPDVDSIMILIITFFIYAIGFFWLRYPEILSQEQVLILAVKPRYKESNLKQDQSLVYLNKLQDFIKREEVYLDPEITLYSLAKKLSISPHHLSQVINEKLGLNFFDFINKYRIEKAKLLIKQSNKSSRTILDIAFEVGFNNKTSFNKAFKKNVHMTPSEFRKNYPFEFAKE